MPATHLRRLFFVLLLCRFTLSLLKHKLLLLRTRGGFHPCCTWGCSVVVTLKLNSWRCPKTLVLSSLEVLKFNPEDTFSTSVEQLKYAIKRKLLVTALLYLFDPVLSYILTKHSSITLSSIYSE